MAKHLSPAEIAAVRAEMDRIVVGNPRQTQAFDTFDYLVAHGIAAGGGPKRCVFLQGPSQSGKSTILNGYTGKLNSSAALAAGELPVLMTTLRAGVSTRGLAQNALEEIGRVLGRETGSIRGSENELLHRLDVLLAGLKTRLLIFDEFHHIQNIGSEKTANAVAETIKLFCIQGKCPVVVSGIPEAGKPFIVNRQLVQRAEPMIDLHKLSSTDSADVRLYTNFLAQYLCEIGHVSGLSGLKGFLNREIVGAIHDVTDGVLGATCNLVKWAVQRALQEGRDELLVDDLSVSADKNFCATGLAKSNPFVVKAQKPLRVSA